MAKAICYALFGYEQEKYDNCFPFDTYLSGLLLSIRMNRLVYPTWTNVLSIDQKTYEPYKNILTYLNQNGDIDLDIVEDSGAKLCEAMLWRLRPMHFLNNNGGMKYDHIICRDLDSLSTYREAQAVQVWVNGGRTVHAITDSVSHTIPMLGGMIGFIPGEFRARTNILSHQDLIKNCRFQLENKGTDQKFLNEFIYPVFAKMGEDSITQHYFKGHAKTWLSDYHYCDCWLYKCRAGHEDDCPEDVSLPNVDPEMKETDEVAEHIGAAGYNSQHTMRIMKKYEKRFEDLVTVENEFPEIFYWRRK